MASLFGDRPITIVAVFVSTENLQARSLIDFETFGVKPSMFTAYTEYQ